MTEVPAKKRKLCLKVKKKSSEADGIVTRNSNARPDSESNENKKKCFEEDIVEPGNEERKHLSETQRKLVNLQKQFALLHPEVPPFPLQRVDDTTGDCKHQTNRTHEPQLLGDALSKVSVIQNFPNICYVCLRKQTFINKQCLRIEKDEMKSLQVPEPENFRSAIEEIFGVNDVQENNVLRGNIVSKLRIQQAYEDEELNASTSIKMPHKVNDLQMRSKNHPENPNLPVASSSKNEITEKKNDILSHCPFCQLQFFNESQLEKDAHIARCLDQGGAGSSGLAGVNAPAPIAACPLCGLDFDADVRQLERDAHIAQCLADAGDDDANW